MVLSWTRFYFLTLKVLPDNHFLPSKIVGISNKIYNDRNCSPNLAIPVQNIFSFFKFGKNALLLVFGIFLVLKGFHLTKKYKKKTLTL